MTTFKLIATAIVVAATAWVAGAEARERPTIALVLSGGGAAGVAHVGVIKELERLGIRPDIVTGTSMGAVVGGLYASGFTPEDLERAVTEVDWTRILDDASERELVLAQRRDSRLEPLSIGTELPVGLGPEGPRASAGLIDGVKLTLILRQLSVHASGIHDFDTLPIRFRAVATDLLTGQPVVLGSGDLAVAMRASMSIPGFFPPVKRDGMVLVDGGVTNNLPIDVAREMGADIVIASFIPPAKATEEQVSTLTGALGQSMAIYIHARSRALIATLSGRDVLITPAVENVGMLDFDAAPETVTEGVAAVERERAAVVALLADRAPAEPRPSVGDTAAQKLRYDRIEIEYDGRLDTEVIRRRLDLPERGEVTPHEIEIAARRVYGLDLFENVTYRFENQAGARVLIVTATQKDQGLLKPRLGVAVSNVFGGDGAFTVAAGAALTELTPLGGRLEFDVAIGQVDGVFARFEQPLDPGLTFTIGAETAYYTRTATLYANVDDPLSEVTVDTFFSRGLVIWTPGDWGGVGGFVSFESTGASVESGVVPGAGGDDIREERVQAGFTLNFDTLDDVDLPSSGVQIGAEAAFDVADPDRVGAVQLDALAAASLGRHTLSPYAYVAGELEPGAFSANFIGGFPKLPGLDDGELSGDVVGAAGLRYYYRMDFVPYFGSDAFVGVSAAYGGAYRDWDEIGGDGSFVAGSAFAGVETLFGPAMIGFGAAEQGQYAVTLTLGPRF